VRISRIRHRGGSTCDELPIPAHPYRDTLLLHGALAVGICLLTFATGRDVGRAAAIAAAYFAAATAWSWIRFWQRIRAAEKARVVRERAEERV
jgi:hypothetical protein